MRSRVQRAVLIGMGVAQSMLLGACNSGVKDQVRTATEGSHQQIDRGRYLVLLADCTGCHTVPGSGQTFAGGRTIETPFGKLISPNITPDRETGIGAWSDAEFDAAMREGRTRGGAHLYPAMPYPYYARLTQQDVMDIRAYLNTVKPITNPVHVNQLPFPFNIRAIMGVWNALYFKRDTLKTDPKQSAEWNRGAYLVEGPGHCGSCHTPKSFLGGDEESKHLRGGTIQGWFAPDITNATPQGLGKWRVEEVMAYLKSGHTNVTAASGLMAEEIAYASSQFKDEDLRAIAVYLKSLGGKSEAHTAIAQNDPRMRAGEAIYVDRCSACHAKNGEGVPNLFPSLAQSAAVRAHDPTTLVRIVLRGTRSVGTDAEPTAPGMPSFAWQLSNEQVADVLTYVRNRWGDAAQAVDEDDVGDAREDLAKRND